jgi:class 3 adenylate cyclase
MMSVEVPERNLPARTVTFLFTDIEGSTSLLKQLNESYAFLLADQREILRIAFEKWDGREIDTQGDAFFASFPRATQAVAAVVEIQRALAAHDWPGGVQVRVRMGLHTGEPWLVEEGYVGMDVHRAARIAHVGHGEQVLLSETTAPLVQDELPKGVALLDLGRHRLKDLRRPEHIHQLVIDGLPSEFPPLNSLEVVSSPGEHEAQAAARAPREVGSSPYRGLAAFQEDDAHFFFGREAFTSQLVEAVQKHSLVAVVVGSSGSGKSSCVPVGHPSNPWLAPWCLHSTISWARPSAWSKHSACLAPYKWVKSLSTR